MDIYLTSMYIYQALTEKNKSEVLSLCRKLQAGPMHVVTMHGDSVLHVALYSVQVKLAGNLLDMCKGNPLWMRALTRTNDVGNTVLHEAATHDEFLPVAKKLLGLNHRLLSVRNKKSETPLFSAACCGQMKMFKFLDGELYRQLRDGELAGEVHKKGDGSTILHAAIDAEHFELAFSIAKKHEYLHEKQNSEGLTALQLLACNPLAFRFRGKGWLKTFIDSRIKNNNEDEDSNHLLEEKVTSGCSTVPRWDEMLRKRRRYNAVVNLAKLLIKIDTSWAVRDYVGTPDAKSTVVDSKNGENKIEAELKKIEDQLKNIEEQLKKTDQDELKKTEAKKKKDERQQIPLLLATQTACYEIVEEILRVNPQAVEYIDKKGRNILHIAIKYRQIVIFDRVVEGMKVHRRRLIQKCDMKGNSVLHMVGKKIRNEVVEKTEKLIPAFHLQDDLLLFERVKKIMSPHFYRNINHDGNTAEELFTANREKLRVMSAEWLRRTAVNCSTFAVSIAAAAFAAAYTIPGGTKENGSPALLNQTFFDLFTVSIVLSLTFTLTAGVIFLSILTSSFQLEDFKHRLPQKLILGSTCLILSVFTMMLAFSSTIVLTIHNKQFWTRIAFYTFAFLPITILAYVYMPVYLFLMKTFKYTPKEIGSFFPRSNSKNIDQSLGEKSNIGADENSPPFV